MAQEKKTHTVSGAGAGSPVVGYSHQHLQYNGGGGRSAGATNNAGFSRAGVAAYSNFLPKNHGIGGSGNGLVGLPRTLLEYIFTFLDLSSLRRISQVCRQFRALLADENSEIWRLQCARRLSAGTLASDLLADVPTYRGKLRGLFHAWDPAECSRNIYVKANGFTIHRNPVAQSTDAAKGKIGFRSGRHCWEVWWEGPLGTVAVVGISTKEAPVQCQGYVALLGSNSESWGWNLVDNVLLHNGDNHGTYPHLNNPPKYQVGERIKVILDCDERTLSFERANCEFLGVAFRGLPDRKDLYPAVSAVYGNTEISMVYLGQPFDG